MPRKFYMYKSIVRSLKLHLVMSRYMYSYMQLIGIQITVKEEQNTLPYRTIRHTGCEILLPQNAPVLRCTNCSNYRNSLRSQLSHDGSTAQNPDSRTDPSSHINTCYLRMPEKDLCIRKLHDTTCVLSGGQDPSSY